MTESGASRPGVLAADRCPSMAAIGVVVPAHDEQELLPACLRSIDRAARAVPVPVQIVVALDRCGDGTAEVVEAARRSGVAVRPVPVGRPGVGAARAAGVRAVLEQFGAAGLWLATTDADSEVGEHWLARQLAHARLGADVVIGTVRVADWTGQPAGVRERFVAAYRPEPGHRHRHGANLAFTARRYLAAGGFAELACDEDVDLISRLEAAGSTMVWAADLAVVTSARPVGRAPAGFADYLAGLAEVGDA